MFDWVTDIVEAIGGTVSETVASMGEAIAESIFGAFLQWIYEIVFGAIADFFTYITSMGAELFDLDCFKTDAESIVNKNAFVEINAEDYDDIKSFLTKFHTLYDNDFIEMDKK